MNPLRLTLKGFRGIKDGLGLDTFELDLEGLGDARLVAIAGPNGKGKSTVLDNLHPFPILPSRAASYSVSAFSMYDHIVAPEGSKELDWAHRGKKYRSSFVWRAAAKRKSSEAYLFEHQDGMGWVPVRGADGTVSDGKVDTYMRTLVEVVGTSEMFFSSQFSAQGRRKLHEYKQGERKDLLVELLNLTEITQLSANASQVVKGLGSAADALRIAASQPADAVQESVLLAQQAQVVSQIGSFTEAKATEEGALRIAQEAVANAKAAIERDTSKDVRERLQRELTTLVSNEQRETTQRGAQERQLHAEAATLANAAKRSETDLAAQCKTRRDGITYRESLLAQREVVLAAPATAGTLTAEIAKLEEAIKAANERLQAQIKARGELATLDASLKAKRDGFSAAKQALAQIEVRAQLAVEVPCTGSELQPKCKLLADAMEAIGKVPAAQKALEDLKSEGEALSQRRPLLEAKTREGGEPQKDISAAEQTLRGLRKSLDDASRLAAMAPALERAHAELEQLQVEIVNLEAQHAKASAEREARQAEISSVLAAHATEAADAQAFFGSERARIADELSKVGAPDASAVTRATAACEAQASRLRQVERDLAQATNRVASIASQIGTAREGERQRAELRARHDRIRAEMAYWQLLAKGLGKDGIVAMLIDEAGPTIAALANDILLACYGRRFTLSIVTQREQANGGMAEDFDVLVHDAESDEAKRLSVMSGGQKVWINEALTRAIALYRQRSEQQYGALFGDEADGPLDAEKKHMFVAMQRKVLELGGYERAFFITQTPELLAHADHVIFLGARE